MRPILAADATIFVLNGLQPGNEATSAREGIVPVINSREQWRQWASGAKALRLKLPAVLQFDTGMSRLGVPPQEWATLAGLVKAENGIEVQFIMSHLASADDAASDQNADQLAEMNRITSEFPQFPVCFANSGGIFLGKTYHGVLARAGIALYGGAPTAGRANPMEPVVRLEVAVVQTRTVPAGTRVGYSATHVTTGETRLATIAAGYADGLPRSLSGRGAVYCDGIRLRIVGRVSMDSITIDISALPEGRIRLGSLVEVLGPNQTLEDIARDARTISYEILTGLGHRYQRQFRWPFFSPSEDIMKVIVLGAGIVGVTTAYQLAKTGHEVTVVDRQPGPALETSFANAGEVSFGYCSPWAAPGIPMKALKWLFMHHAPLILRPKVDAAMISWLVRMLSNCTSKRYAINKSRMLRLAVNRRAKFTPYRRPNLHAETQTAQMRLKVPAQGLASEQREVVCLGF
ncbi:alanine racemase [Sinorhizobium fredii]